MPSAQDINLSHDKDDVYDQAVILSQGMINARLQDLFNSIPKPLEVYYSSRNEDVLDCELGVPSIIINSDAAANEMLYLLRIKSGKFCFKDGTSLEIHDWVLAVPTKVQHMAPDGYDDDPKEVKALKKSWNSRMNGFDRLFQIPPFVPGDYSAQRILCALSHGQWSRLDPNYSEAFDPMTKRATRFNDFMDKAENVEYKKRIETLLEEWVKLRYLGGHAVTTMGITFHIPIYKNYELQPNNGAVYGNSHPQAYPFLNGEGGRSMGEGNYSDRNDETPYGKLVDGDYNCLLLCENNEYREGFSKLTFEHGGNLIQPGASYGSFIFGRRFFLRDILYPRLGYARLGLQLNQASLFNRIPSQSLDYQRASYYDTDNIERDGNSYRWSYTTTKSANLMSYTATSSLEVCGEMGKPQVNIKGKIVSKQEAMVLPESGDVGLAEYLDWRYDLSCTWSLKLLLETVPLEKTENNRKVKLTQLKQTLEGLDKDNLPIDIKIASKYGNSKKASDQKEDKDMEETLKETIQESMKWLKSNMEDEYEWVIYPGYGELEFTDPKFTALGHLATKARYQLPADPGITMNLPAVKRPDAPKPKPAPVATKPTSEATKPTPVATKPTPEAKKPTPVATKPTPEAKKPTSEATKPTPEATKPTSEATKPTSEATKPAPVITGPPPVEPTTPATFQPSLKHVDEPVLRWTPSLIYNGDKAIGRLTLRGENTAVDTTGNGLGLAFDFVRISLEHTPHENGEGKMTAPKLFSEQSWRLADEAAMRSGYEAGHLGNMYRVDCRWDASLGLVNDYYGATFGVKATSSVSKQSRSLNITLEPSGTDDSSAAAEDVQAFVVPNGTDFKIVLQGNVAELGHYAIKIHESCKILKHGEIKDGKYAIDWKMARLKVGAGNTIEPETWDVSTPLAV